MKGLVLKVQIVDRKWFVLEGYNTENPIDRWFMVTKIISGPKGYLIIYLKLQIYS